jgi:hypothetical protein
VIETLIYEGFTLERVILKPPGSVGEEWLCWQVTDPEGKVYGAATSYEDAKLLVHHYLSEKAK